MKFKALDLTLASMFVGLMAIGANITSFVPFMMVGGVPITLQTFFAILSRDHPRQPLRSDFNDGLRISRVSRSSSLR